MQKTRTLGEVSAFAADNTGTKEASAVRSKSIIEKLAGLDHVDGAAQKRLPKHPESESDEEDIPTRRKSRKARVVKDDSDEEF